MTKPTRRERWARRLDRANARLVKSLRAALRREFALCGVEFEQGRWDWTIHRQRIESLLAGWYAASFALFGRLAVDMIASARAEDDDDDGDVAAVLLALAALSVAESAAGAIVATLKADAAVVAAVEAALAAEGSVAGALAVVQKNPVVMQALAAAVVAQPPPPSGGGSPPRPPALPPGPPPTPPPVGPPPEDPAFRDRVAQFVRQFAPDRGRKIAAATQDAVTEALAKAAREGLGEAATARRVREALAGTVSVRRARTIARTEIGSAQNAAILFTADGAERQDVRRIWLAIDDARTRPSHAAADGQTIGPGERFLVGGFALAHPGDPNGPAREIVNCRCSMLLERIP